MDQVEDIERDREGDRLSGRDVNAERVSGVETDREMSAKMKDYYVVNSGDDDERSPPRLELTEQYRDYIHSRPTQSPTIRRTLPSPPSTSPPPSFYNGHLQCPLPACASYGAGRDDIDPWPS